MGLNLSRIDLHSLSSASAKPTFDSPYDHDRIRAKWLSHLSIACGDVGVEAIDAATSDMMLSQIRELFDDIIVRRKFIFQDGQFVERIK